MRWAMMMTTMVIKTPVPYRHLMQVIAQEDFIKFSHCESSRTYIILEWILGKWGGRRWTGCIWLRMGTSGGFLCTW
jgi:hypothetical protein